MSARSAPKVASRELTVTTDLSTLPAVIDPNDVKRRKNIAALQEEIEKLERQRLAEHPKGWAVLWIICDSVLALSLVAYGLALGSASNAGTQDIAARWSNYVSEIEPWVIAALILSIVASLIALRHFTGNWLIHSGLKIPASALCIIAACIPGVLLIQGPNNLLMTLLWITASGALSILAIGCVFGGYWSITENVSDSISTSISAIKLSIINLSPRVLQHKTEEQQSQPPKPVVYDNIID